MKKLSVVVLVGIFVLGMVGADLVAPTAASAATKFVTIGTGGVTGVYYPTGGAIGKIVNKKRDEYGIRVTVESTGGSVFNVNAVMAGDLEFGIVQSDRQYQAINGLAEWEDRGKQEKLRAVCSFHPESITLVAAVESGIETFKDLEGNIVNIGNPGSGQRQNSIDALTAVGIDYENDIQAEGLKAAEAPKMLQDGRIDAFFYTVGHPSGAIKEATSGRRKVRFIAVEGSGLDELIAKNPFYAKAFVPVDMYPQAENDADVPTFGVKATFVTNADVSEDIVYAVTKEIFDNLEDFKKLHPAYAVLTKENMLQGLSAPIHPGALKYYEEAGLADLIPDDLK
jgi:uncharacterized protein